MRLIRNRFLMLVLTLTLILQPFAFARTAYAADPADYTIMIYMNGTDLESGDETDPGGDATDNLEEMMKVGSSAKLNILVETVGTSDWWIDGIESDRTQRWRVEKDHITLVDDTVGVTRVDDPAALTDFIVWGQTNYPAKRYVLIFWDHGGGAVEGFGSDELHDNTSLLLDGIEEGVADAVKTTKKPFEIIGFDTCLMATIEVADILSPYARYLVASEETEPANGWDYAAIMQAVTNNSQITGDALGKVIADSYEAHSGTDDEITLSVTDLGKVDAVVKALEKLVGKASPDLDDQDKFNRIGMARALTEEYAYEDQHSSDMADLGDLARRLTTLYPTEAKALRAAIDKAVVYQVKGQALPDATGLSIFFPYNNEERFDEMMETYLEHTPFSPDYQAFAFLFGMTLFEDDTPIQFLDATPDTDAQGGLSLASVTVDPAHIAEITENYAVLATRSPNAPERLRFVAMDSLVTLDQETGELVDQLQPYAFSVNGHLFSLFQDSQNEVVTTYWIPALLNGEEVDLRLLVNNATEMPTIIGAWPGIDEETQMPSKELIQVEPGDRLTPLYYYYDEELDAYGFEPGEEFIVTDELTPAMTELPEDEYLYGFYVVDMAGNEAVSAFTEITISDEISVDPAATEIHDEQILDLLRSILEDRGGMIQWDGETLTIYLTTD